MTYPVVLSIFSQIFLVYNVKRKLHSSKEKEGINEGLNGVKRVAWNVQKVNRMSWKREKIKRVPRIIFVHITVLFDYLVYLVYLVFLVWRKIKRAPWNREIFNRVPCLLHPNWDPHRLTRFHSVRFSSPFGAKFDRANDRYLRYNLVD